MGLGLKAVIFLLTAAFCSALSIGAVYKVGDDAGWTTIGHVDYKNWSSTKTFHVGDTILFEYKKEYHNVMRVTHKDYNACNATSPKDTFSSGNDSFHVKRLGHYYFICGVPGHCLAGQKVDIRVVEHDKGLAPSSSPSENPIAEPPIHSFSPAPAPGSSGGSTDKHSSKVILFVTLLALGIVL